MDDTHTTRRRGRAFYALAILSLVVTIIAVTFWIHAPTPHCPTPCDDAAQKHPNGLRFLALVGGMIVSLVLTAFGSISRHSE